MKLWVHDREFEKIHTALQQTANVYPGGYGFKMSQRPLGLWFRAPQRQILQHESLVFEAPADLPQRNLRTCVRPRFLDNEVANTSVEFRRVDKDI